MEFLPTVSLQTTTGEMVVWSALREALRPDEGFAFLRYPIFPTSEAWRYEPDILLLHRQLGLVIIEVKDCRAEQVEALEGQVWRMRDWRSPTETPYEQAQNQMWAMLKRFRPDLGDRLRGTALVALPNVPEAEWRERGFDKLPCNPGILHQDQLTPARLRKRLYALTRGDTRPLLNDEEWRLACEVMGLRPVLAQMREPRPALDDTAAAIAPIRASETAIPKLDLEQLRIGMEIPPGPQRIRGIAGSGKTLLLAMKAARMHLSHPDWDIAVTFYTKSLYQVVRQHITRFCRFFGDRDPDWSKLQVLHGWGSQKEMGLYRACALAAGHPPRSFGWAKERVGNGPGDHLTVCCEELLATGRVKPAFDAILIDEGQDFLPAFYQLARAALRPPHRLIWAYDEAQSLDHLHVPDAETLFGRDADGKLQVDLAGQYPGGIWKSRVMRKCYRTPSRILMPAHAFGMGLLRPNGPVSLITTKAGWEDIGYQVESGSFEAAGREVVITRPQAHCPHPLDGLQKDWIVLMKPESRAEELEGCALTISRLQASGVELDEMLVVALGTYYQDDLKVLAAKLAALGVEAHMADEQNASAFRKPGAVTLSGIHRAKGHEAPFVFVLRLDQLARREGDVAARNQIFVALTRSRGLCRLSGTVPAAAALFAELEQVLEAGNRLAFRTTDPRRLRRNLADEAEPTRLAPFVRHIPLYDLPAAATSPWLPPQLPDPDDVEWVDASALGTLDERMFAVRVRGDSMEPRIQDGAVAVFRRAEGGYAAGDIVLASVGSLENEGVSLVIKRLARQETPEPIYSLLSENPRYEPIVVTEEDQVHVEGVFRGLIPS